METIAIAAHKGGAGKTTVAVNLGAALAAQGKTVVVVDLDPQGAAAAALGVGVRKPTVYEALVGQADPRQAIMGTAVDGLAIFAADLDLAGAEVELPRRPDWQGSLQRLLAPLEGLCDVALLDTPPGLGVLSLCALVAADSALAVCPPDFLSYRTLPHLLETLERAGTRVLGIVPTFAKGPQTRHAREVAGALLEDHPELALPGIPRRVGFADAALAGKPITTYAPSSDAAAAFKDLAEEVSRRATAAAPVAS